MKWAGRNDFAIRVRRGSVTLGGGSFHIPARSASRDIGDELRNMPETAQSQPAAIAEICSTCGKECSLEAELGSLAQAGSRDGNRTNRPRQCDLAKINAFGRQNRSGQRGDQRGGNRQIRGRLVDPQAAGYVEIDIMLAEP